MVLWLTSGRDSVLHHLFTTATEFKKKQHAEPTWGLSHTPLKQVLAQALFRELRDRHSRVINTQELQARAQEMGWKDSAGWRFQAWNPKLKVLEHDTSRSPVTEQEMTRKLESFVENIKGDVVHRFHCTQRMTETMEGKKTFKLDLSVRNKSAEAVWDLLVELKGCCVFQLIGVGYRREKLGKGPLAQKIQEMIRY